MSTKNLRQKRLDDFRSTNFVLRYTFRNSYGVNGSRVPYSTVLRQRLSLISSSRCPSFPSWVRWFTGNAGSAAYVQYIVRRQNDRHCFSLGCFFFCFSYIHIAPKLKVISSSLFHVNLPSLKILWVNVTTCLNDTAFNSEGVGCTTVRICPVTIQREIIVLKCFVETFLFNKITHWPCKKTRLSSCGKHKTIPLVDRVFIDNTSNGVCLVIFKEITTDLFYSILSRDFTHFYRV